MRQRHNTQASYLNGLGAQLMTAIADHLIGAGYEAMLVWVLAANPARRFYKRIGGTYAREQLFDLGGSQQIEARYGWNNKNTLRRRQPRS